MGSRCWGCGEKFGRCYEHGGDCPPSCANATHDCSDRLHYEDVE